MKRSEGTGETHTGEEKKKKSMTKWGYVDEREQRQNQKRISYAANNEDSHEKREKDKAS